MSTEFSLKANEYKWRPTQRLLVVYPNYRQRYVEFPADDPREWDKRMTRELGSYRKVDLYGDICLCYNPNIKTLFAFNGFVSYLIDRDYVSKIFGETLSSDVPDKIYGPVVICPSKGDDVMLCKGHYVVSYFSAAFCKLIERSAQ